jgi:type VI secretion system protein ImpG
MIAFLSGKCRMEKLLPYYERQLFLLRQLMAEFSRRFPKLAARLGISGDECSDPGIQRLIQGTALLCARIARRIAYGHVRFTNDLLGIQSPFYLRPIPSCSVAQVEGTGSTSETTIPRGTELRSKGARPCGFRTAYDVTLGPMNVTAHFMPHADAPATLRLPAGIGCAIAIAIETTDPAITLDDAASSPVRIYIDADAATRAAFYDALFMHTLCTCVESDQQWRKLPALPFSPVGFSEEQALLPTPWRQEDSLRLLAEYFAFPDKFDFFDIDLQAVLANGPAGTRRLMLHLLLPDLHHTTTPGLLRALSPTALRLGCTPVINMFTHAAAPIRLRRRRKTYGLTVPRVGDAKATVYSIDAMKLLHGTDAGGMAIDMQWFYEKSSKTRHCWLFELADACYGTADTVSFVDEVQQPLALNAGTVDVQVTCTNGDLPCALPLGRPDGDLASDQDTGGRPIRLLRKPSASLLLADQPDGHWDVIAVGHARHRNQAQLDLATLLFLLRMHARPDSAVTARQLAGILGVSRRTVQEWLKFRVGSALTKGHEITLTIDEAAFAERSISVFAQVMERVFVYYFVWPLFLRLNVVGRDGQVLIKGALLYGPQSPA